MLAENKWSKYLLYAIGEILLVVIGILIALQLNNWNSERIGNHKRVSYLENLVEDLKIDTLNLNYRIKFYQDILDKRNNLMSLTQFENISTDTLQNLIIPEYGSYQLNITTFTKITNQGISHLSENDSLSRRIYFYYTAGRESFNTIIQWEVETTNNDANYWLYGQDEYEVQITNEFPQFQDKTENRQALIKLISDPKGRNYLKSDYYRKQRVLDLYLDVKEYAVGLIKGIEDELLPKTE